ncbi:MAG: hypothetical protein QGF33_13610, partial [Alphaproteobacteria bacterium]|nr:hypothetical protein [Alphaproteobacteria bacterium]
GAARDWQRPFEKKLDFTSQFDHVIWCGDLNYRIALKDDDVRALVAKGELSTLLAADELQTTRRGGLAWLYFEESPIAFAPTYKYDLNSDEYDTSPKRRAPAWCDRVLWRSLPAPWPSRTALVGCSAGAVDDAAAAFASAWAGRPPRAPQGRSPGGVWMFPCSARGASTTCGGAPRRCHSSDE